MCEGAVGPSPSVEDSVCHDDMLESVLPMETVSSAHVANLSSSRKFNAHTTDLLSSDDTSEAGESMSWRPKDRDRRAPLAPVGV